MKESKKSAVRGTSKRRVSERMLMQAMAVSVAASAIIPAVAVGIPVAEASEANVFKVTFSESELQKGVKTVTIPDLVNVQNVKVNTGDVSFTQDGDQLTITVDKGAPSRTAFNPQKYSKPVSNTKTGSTDSFAASNAYSDADGYSATLAKSGAATVKSGSYVPAETKRVTGQTSANYSDGQGFSGTLSQYVYSGSYTPAESKAVSDSRTSSSNSFASSLSYNSGGFSGTLTKSGGVSSVQTGGSYTPGDSKYVTAQTSSWYNSGGYSGYLDSYVYSGSYTPGDSKTANTQMSVSLDLYKEALGAGSADYVFARTTYYSSGGYSGTLSRGGVSTSSITQLAVANYSGIVTRPASDTRTYRYQGYVNKPASDSRTYSYTQNYSGTVTKPSVDTRTYRYQGDVVKPAVDTRTWEQTYSGTAYKGGDDLFYSYDVEIEYTTDDTPPELTVSDPGTTPTNQDVLIRVTATDESGIRSLKWAAGDRDAAYFQNSGTDVTNDTFSVGENGVYTVFAEDNAGNTTVKTVTVSCIDKEPPADATFTVSETALTHETITVGVQYPDDAVKQEVRIDEGEWVDYVEPINFTQNGTLHARSTDEAGNVSNVTSYTVDNHQAEEVGDALFGQLIAELAGIKQHVLSGQVNAELQDIRDRLDEILVEKEQLTKADQKETVSQKVQELQDLLDLLELILSGSDGANDEINRLPDSPVKDELLKEQAAKEAVAKAEETLDGKDLSTAEKLVDNLKDGIIKEELQDRLDAIKQAVKDRDAFLAAQRAVEQAEKYPSNYNVNKAEEALSLVKDGPDKQELRDRLDAVIHGLLITEAEKQVTAAEKFKRDPYLANAQATVTNLPDGREKDDFQARLDAIQSGMEQDAYDKLLDAARKKVEQAERYERDPYLTDAQDAVNKLPVGKDRQDLQGRLDALYKKLDDAANKEDDFDAVDQEFEDMVSGITDEEMNRTLRIVHNAIKRAERYGYASAVRHANNRFGALDNHYWTSHPGIMQFLQDRLDAVNAKLDETNGNGAEDNRTPNQSRAEDAVEKAEQFGTASRIRLAERYVSELEDGEFKSELEARLALLTAGGEQELSKAEAKAQDAVDKAEQYGTNSRIRTAQREIDKLDEGNFKADLQDRLDALVVSK